MNKQITNIKSKIMKQMKTILVPTDFSKHAENALKVAAQIAKKIIAK